VPSMQPTHCTSDMRWAGERLGPERLVGAYAWRSVLDSGAYVAGGSDFPVEDANPFHGIHAAVTRAPREGPDPGWQPAQRMTRDEAVSAFTIWNARSIGREAELGSLEPQARRPDRALRGRVRVRPRAHRRHRPGAYPGGRRGGARRSGGGGEPPDQLAQL